MPDLLLFIAAAAVLTIAPGPDNVYVLTRGITQGKMAGLAAALGFAAGCIFHTALAAFGIAALIKGSPVAFAAVKYAGAAYLIYIGVRTLMAAFKKDAAGVKINPHLDGHMSLGSIFKQSVIGNMFNPKITLFFLSFLPQFINTKANGQMSEAMQMVLLGVVFMLQTIVIFGAIALASGVIGDKLRTRPTLAVWLDRVAGFTFIALGVKVALPDGK